MRPTPPSDSRCPSCGTPMELSGEDALCPGCLLGAALERGFMTDDAAPPDLDECGGYMLEKIIGRGGHGIVFLARRPGSIIPYALKLLASAKLAGPDEIRRFRFEAEAVFQINHRHIIRVVDIGEHDDAPYFVMDYAEGGNLNENAERFLDSTTDAHAAEDRVRLMVKVARAVHYAHERGILHRDLKPANILLDRHGEPLVGDFGLARSLHAPAGVTMTGAALGTPSYMSPEQASGGAVTTATDLYSLGIILYQMLTGRTPFTGNDPVEILRKAASEDVPDPRAHSRWLDRDLATVCLKSLRRDPTRRYSSVAEFADDLERWLAGESVLARPMPWWERMMKWCRRHPVAATFGLTGSLAGIILLALLLTGSVMLRKERNHALAQEAIAKDSAEKAKDSAAKARESAEKARRSEQDAIAARDEFQLNSYAADIYLAYRSNAEGHLGKARKLLSGLVPSTGARDLRGFEWHALDHICKGDDYRVFEDHSGPVLSVAFDPTGKTIASGGRDGKVLVRAVESSIEKTSPLSLGGPQGPGETSALAWSPDGQMLATAGSGCNVRLWSMPDGKPLGTLPVTTTKDLAFSSDGASLCVFLSLTENPQIHELRIYQTKGLALRRVIGGLREAHALSSARNLAAVIPENTNRIDIMDLTKDKPVVSWDNAFVIVKLVFSNDGRSLFGMEPYGIMLAYWNTDNGNRIGSMFPIAGRFGLFLPSPDGKRLASTGYAQYVSCQAINADIPAVTLRGHEDTIHALSYSPDGEWLATAGNDHTCRIWKAKTSPPQIVIPPSFDSMPEAPPEASGRSTDRAVPASATSPDGTWIATGGDDNVITIRRKSDGNPLAILRGHQGTIRDLAVSPDGRTLASCSDDATLRLWHAATWRELGTLHQGEVIHKLAFSKTGEALRGITPDGQPRYFRGNSD